MRIAITREVSPAINCCELTHVERQPIDFDRARAQHREYERCLIGLGCRIHQMPADPHLPDSVFVEDTAVVLDEVAVLARPGAESRRRETDAIEQRLQGYRPLCRLHAPATLDGGDVLRAGRTLFVGQSSRTNAAGIAQLQRLAARWGYAVVPVPVAGCLHLKSAVGEVAPGTLLLNPRWVPVGAFAGFECIPVDEGEPCGANALRIGDTVVCAAAFPRTRERLQSRGITVRAVDLSELTKAEGAVTCCSLIIEDLP
jgi:dimethylargininase